MSRISLSWVTALLLVGLLSVTWVTPALSAEPKDIVDTAVAAGSFGTLVKAVQAAELVDALKGKGPLTVFAPTDEAFKKLPEGTLEKLLQNKERLQAVLKYHVVEGKVMAADVVKLKEAKTLLGRAVRINTEDGVRINRAKVTKTDIECSNGVIHVIDTVLIPREPGEGGKKGGGKGKKKAD